MLLPKMLLRGKICLYFLSFYNYLKKIFLVVFLRYCISSKQKKHVSTVVIKKGNEEEQKLVTNFVSNPDRFRETTN